MMKNTRYNLKILYYNAGSILPNFGLSVGTLKPYLVCIIVRTWLSKEISNNEHFIPGFQLFQLDRDHHGGRVFIYVLDIFLVSVL